MKTQSLPSNATKLPTHSPFTIKQKFLTTDPRHWISPFQGIHFHTIFFLVRSATGRTLGTSPSPACKVSVTQIPLFDLPFHCRLLASYSPSHIRAWNRYVYTQLLSTRSKKFQEIRLSARTWQSGVVEHISNWCPENMHSYVGYWKFACYLERLVSIKPNSQCAYNVTMWRVPVTVKRPRLSLTAWPRHIGVQEISCLWRRSNPDLSAI